jgi:hypothetical protein
MRSCISRAVVVIRTTMQVRMPRAIYSFTQFHSSLAIRWPPMDLGAVALEDLQRNGTAPPSRIDLYGALSAASGGSNGWQVWAHAGGDAVLGKLAKIEKGFLVGAKARSGKAKLISGLQLPAALVAVLKQRAAGARERVAPHQADGAPRRGGRGGRHPGGAAQARRGGRDEVRGTERYHRPGFQGEVHAH